MVATENRILKLAQGHPKTIVQLATQTQRGSLEEVRHYEAPVTHSPLNIGWIALLPILLLLLLWRADGYMATAIIADWGSIPISPQADRTMGDIRTTSAAVGIIIVASEVRM